MSGFTLWLVMLGGPLVWLIYMEVGYALTPLACAGQNKTAISMTLIAALAITLAIALLAWRSWRLAADGVPDRETRALDRSRFMALSGLGLSALSLLAVLASAIPIYLLGACD